MKLEFISDKMVKKEQCSNIFCVVEKQFFASSKVKKFRPKDKDANLKFTECKKIVQRQAFEKAIAVDDSKSVADSLDLDSMGK